MGTQDRRGRVTYAAPMTEQPEPSKPALDTAAAEPTPAGGPAGFPSLCERLLRAPSATPGADDRTLLLAELTPATT